MIPRLRFPGALARGSRVRAVLWGLVLGLVLAAGGFARADIPHTIHYQGRLTQSSGVPLTGQHTLILRLYDAETGGQKLWEERHPLALTSQDNGVFSLVLGSQQPFDGVDFNRQVWLAIDVNGEGEFTPRQPVTAVTYAINADNLDGLDASQFVRTDRLATAPASDVAAVSASGTSTALARQDHTHRGVRSVAVEQQPGLFGDVLLRSGANVTLQQQGNVITIASAGGAGGGLSGVEAGAGLTGGGTSGVVTLDVAAGPGLVAEADRLRADAGTGPGQLVQLDAAGALPGVSGAQLTELDASRITAGILEEARLPPAVSRLGEAIESGEVTDGTLGAADTQDQFLKAGPGVTLEKNTTSWEISAVGSGGDITSVVAGAGLTGGGTSAEVTLDVGAGSGLRASADGLAVAFGALPARAVGAAGGAGQSEEVSRADHVHEGLHSLRASGQPQILGDAILAAGERIALSQTGGTITISAAEGGVSGGRASAFASSAMAISTESDTELLAVTVTKTRPDSVLLVLATAQLTHTGGDNEKTVDVKVFRDATQLDGSYRGRLGQSSRATSELPVSLHAWDAAGAGTYTFRLRARSSGGGAQAGVRRLTVVEL